MNFEGFQDLIHRVVTQWWQVAKKEIVEMDLVTTYLEESPFKAKQTPGNEIAYEKLMDVRVKLYVRKSVFGIIRLVFWTSFSWRGAIRFVAGC